MEKKDLCAVALSPAGQGWGSQEEGVKQTGGQGAVVKTEFFIIGLNTASTSHIKLRN